MNKSTNTPAVIHPANDPTESPFEGDSCPTWSWCVEDHSDPGTTWHSDHPIELTPTPYLAHLVADGDAEPELLLTNAEGDEVARLSIDAADALFEAVQNLQTARREGSAEDLR